MRLLELWLRRHAALPNGGVAQFLRVQNPTTLGFPASQLQWIATEPRDVPIEADKLSHALRASALKSVHITPAFMGLLGVNGTLPAHYTERIAPRSSSSEDEGPRAFLDAFSHRALMLFYAAWRKYKFDLQCRNNGDDPFLSLLLSFAGVGHAALRRQLRRDDDGQVLEQSIAYFSAALHHRPPSAVLIERVLSEYFDQPIEVVQFVGRWYDVPLQQQSRLGAGNARLGSGAVAGARVWQHDLRLRIVVGPLSRESYASFLPGGKASRALKSLLGMFNALSLEYEVQLVLRAADVRGITLTEPRADGRLGWDCFLVNAAQTQDRRDVCYDLHAL